MTTQDKHRSAPETVEISTTDARQGVTGHNVRYVLLAGTVCVVILFVIAYAMYFG